MFVGNGGDIPFSGYDSFDNNQQYIISVRTSNMCFTSSRSTVLSIVCDAANADAISNKRVIVAGLSITVNILSSIDIVIESDDMDSGASTRRFWCVDWVCNFTWQAGKDDGEAIIGAISRIRQSGKVLLGNWLELEYCSVLAPNTIDSYSKTKTHKNN